MQLFNPTDNSLLLDVAVDDNSYRYKEIMGQNTLSLYFSIDTYVDIPLGTYCTFKNERYYVLKPVVFAKNNSCNFKYTLVMDSNRSTMADVKFKFFTLKKVANQPDVLDSPFQIKFSLTASPAEFAQRLADNMNQSDPQGGWSVGACFEPLPVLIDFNGDDCFSVLGKVATAFTCEWDVTDKVISFPLQVEQFKDSAITLSYGKDCGFLPPLGRANYNGAKMINRLFIEGSDRNINLPTYGNATLLMPKSTTITYMGIDYVTDATGTFLERKDRQGARVVEDCVDCTSIYPSRVGTVTGVQVDDDAHSLYSFFDTSITDDLDFSKLVIAGETMTVIFQTGLLAGREFDVAYTHATRRFALVPLSNAGVNCPQAPLVMAVGDTYAVFHMSLPQAYIDEAQTAVLNKAVQYLYKNEQAQYTFTCPLDPLYAKRNWGAIGGLLGCGNFVNFSDNQFLKTPQLIRIVNVKEYINKPLSPEIQLSNQVAGSTLASVLNKIPTNAQAADRKDTDVVNYTKRRFADTQELIDALYDPSGNFQTELLSALVLQAMLVRLGDPTLQYQFMDATYTSVIEPAFAFNPATKTFACPACFMQHMTLGIDSVQPNRPTTDYYRWQLVEYVSAVLTDAATPYYLYLQVPNDGVKQGESGIFLLSATKIGQNDVAGKYTFWVGFLNSEFNGDRSYRSLYGFTEILPGQATLNNIISSDGKSYLRLLANQFKCGGLDWNVTKKDTLTVDNATIKTALKVDGEALIAGFNFSDQNIKSTQMAGADPAMLIDGIDGKIVLESIVQTWTEKNGTADVKQTLVLDSQSGLIQSSDDQNHVAQINSQGIFANFAGQQALSSGTGMSLKGAVVGLGFGSMDKDAWNNASAMAGVVGIANNKSLNPAPAYGGYFLGLMVRGLHLGVRNTLQTETSVTLGDNDTYVTCYNAGALTIYLPPNPNEGRAIYMRQMNANGFTIDGNGNKINTDGSNHLTAPNRAGQGDTTLVVWDGTYWCLNYMPR